MHRKLVNISHIEIFHDNTNVNVENIKTRNDITIKSINVMVNDVNVNRIILVITDITPSSNLFLWIFINFMVNNMIIEIIKINMKNIVNAANVYNNLLYKMDVNIDDIDMIIAQIPININNDEYTLSVNNENLNFVGFKT